MAEENKERAPCRIRSLADLKQSIKPGTEFVSTYHANYPDIVGLTRVVTEVQANCFYSKIKDQPEHKWSTCNHSRGLRTDFEKASLYTFNGNTVTVMDRRSAEPRVLFKFEVYEPEMTMTEQKHDTMRMEMM